MLAELTSRSHLTLALAAAALISSRAIAFNPSNRKVYAVDESRGAVSVIDTARNSSISVPVGRGPDALAINTVTGNVYVSNSADGTISVLDASNKVTATVKAGPHPYTLAVNAATNKIYVTNTFSDIVGVIDGSTNQTTSLHIGSADNLAIDSQNNRIFLIGYEDPNIRVLNGATGFVEKTPAHEHLWGMALNETTGDLYVTGSGNADVLLGSKNISVGAIPCAIALNPETGMLYAVNYGDNTITVINIKTNQPVATVKVGKGPQALTVDSRVNRIYVANTHDNSVTIIDGHANAAVKTVPAGKNPFAITIGSNKNFVYVANLSQPSFTAVKVSE